MYSHQFNGMHKSFVIMYIKQANKQHPFQCTWVIFFFGLLFVSGMVQYLKMDST